MPGFTALAPGPPRRRQLPLQVPGFGERHSGALSLLSNCTSTMTRWNVRPPATTSFQICCRISRGRVSRRDFEPTSLSGIGTGLGDGGLVSGIRPAKSIWTIGKGSLTSGAVLRLRLELGLPSPKRLKGRFGRIKDINLVIAMGKGIWAEKE